ncbi:MAG: hypothetical protein AB7V43_07530 [Acidimicrobiia bacterium]
MTKPQVLGVGEVVSLDTTPLDPVDRAEFDNFVSRVEPLVRRSLVATHGPGAGRSAALDALAWAWLHWDRVVDVRSPAAHLVRIGTISTRRGRLTGLVDAQHPADREQVELTQTLATGCGAQLATELAALVPSDRVALLLHRGWDTPIGEVAQVLSMPRSTVRRRGERIEERLGSDAGSSSITGSAADALAGAAAGLEALAPVISSAEVVEHAEHFSARLPDEDEIVEEQSRRRIIVGVVTVVVILAAVVWWAGGRSNTISAVAPSTTASNDASVFAPTGIAAQPELTVYPILPDPPDGFRLIDRSLMLEPSQTYGQVITGLVRNDPEPWRRRLWLFDPNGTVVASIATFDGDSAGGSDFARTVDIGGVSVEIGQDTSDDYRWWALVHGVSAGSSTTGAVYIAGVAGEAMATLVATQVVGLDPRDPQFAVSLAADLGSGWQISREPRTVDIAAARYLREDGASIYVSSFAAPAQSDFSVIYPAAEPSIAIGQVDGPLFVSIAVAPPGAFDRATVQRLAESVRLVRGDDWSAYAVERTSLPTPDPAGDLIATGLTSAEGGPVTVGIPDGQLCIRVGKSPNPIRASGTTCNTLRPQPSMSTSAVVWVAATSGEPSPERFVGGSANTAADRIRYAIVDIDGAVTTAEAPLIRDPSLGPALWAVRVPPAGRLLSVEYLDDVGKVLDRLGPSGA